MLKVKVNSSEEKMVSFEDDAVVVDGNKYTPDIAEMHDGSYHMLLNGSSFSCEILDYNKEEKTLSIKVNNRVHEIHVKSKFDLLLEEMGLDSLLSAKVNDVKAPMPGLVLNVLVENGDSVSKGDGLLVLEAMKMENIIKSPADGIIKNVPIEVGAAVDKNQVLIELE
jgi:biotin carboxyl carrier protein